MNEWKKFFSGTWRLTKSYWQSEEKYKAWGLLAVIVALNLAGVYVLVLFNKWYNKFYNALQEVNKEATFDALQEFAVLAFIHIVMMVYRLYLRQMLELKWRRWITNVYLKGWLDNQNYYRMQLTGSYTDNPDQRISDDLRLFTNITLRLSLGLLNAVVMLASFIFILWELSGAIVLPFGESGLKIPGYMVWAAVAYAVVGTYLTHIIGKPLIRLNFNQQRYEADFRFSLVRLRENSESVAFYGGEAQERQYFGQKFHYVFSNFWEIMRRQKKLTWFTAFYGQAAVIFPVLMAAPRYFAREIHFGELMQIIQGFGKVQDALSFFVDAYPELAEWRAVVDRLTGFVDDMENARAVKSGEKLAVIPSPSASSLVLSDLQINLPDGKNLLRDFNLQLNPGDSLLVTGASGVGKSTLLRALAGIWPYAEGRIDLPRYYHALFVPQKPYLPLGTLREALLYPQVGGVADEKIKKVLELCFMDKFYKYLDHTEDWARVFSLGEQQKIAFARILLKEPKWLFLDEATSALDEASEGKLYELLREKLVKTTIVSVGHRSTLSGYHQKKLALTGGGQWSLLQ